MRYRFLFLFLIGLMCTIGAKAQTEQQITDLKLSRKVIYADSYEGKLLYDKAKLRQRNQLKLEYMIRTFLVQDLGLSVQDAQELYDFVDDKLQNVERTIDGTTIAHMFSFISKESLVSLVQKNKYDFSGLAEFVANPELYEIDDTLQKSLDSLTHEVHFVDTMTVSVDTIAVSVDTITISVDTVIVSEDVITAPMDISSVEEKPVLVEELLKFHTFSQVTQYLAGKKKAGTIRWGTVRNMKDCEEKCYVVIINSQSNEVNTILGPGSGKRINYRSGEECSLADFSNCLQIYVLPL